MLIRKKLWNIHIVQTNNFLFAFFFTGSNLCTMCTRIHARMNTHILLSYRMLLSYRNNIFCRHYISNTHIFVHDIFLNLKNFFIYVRYKHYNNNPTTSYCDSKIFFYNISKLEILSESVATLMIDLFFKFSLVEYYSCF